MALIDILKVNVPTEFGCEFEDDDMNDSMWELIRSIDRIKEFDYTDYAYGASQFCIMPAGREDIVIKIPFAGMYNYDDNEDVTYFEEFYTPDYCKLSVDIFVQAVDAEVCDIFAKTALFGYSANGYPIYTQPRIAEAMRDGGKHEGSKDSMNYIKSKRSTDPFGEYNRFNINWLATAIDWYGAEFMDKTLKFIKDNQYIDDLHEGNYGWMASGQPIIFDYAGFEY